MPSPTPSELKKLLIGAGFEIYRTLGSRVLLAERVRDNLIMDSGVSVLSHDEGLRVRFLTRAQASDFPGENDEQLFERARRVGAEASPEGFSEVETAVCPIHDPGDRERVLDTWYEVAFEARANGEEGGLELVRYAFRITKTATR